jgi:3-hydroxyacyl-CoA dehydrogenase
MAIGKIKKITVLGQGNMGPDIALAFALQGFEVTCVDPIERQLKLASERIAQNCRQLVEEDALEQDKAVEIKSRVAFTIQDEPAIAGADFVMESTPEQIEIKQAVFAHCDALCPAHVIIASGTSSMSIAAISAKMNHPERAVIAHFTIPAHLSPLVEVVLDEKTSQSTREGLLALLNKVGKHAVLCKDTPGFLHNYLQAALVGASLELLEKGIASADEIDAVVNDGFGLRLAAVGPIRFLDMCGLDTVRKVQQYLYSVTRQPVYKSSGLIEEMVQRGELGVKSGKGFYEYATRNSQEFWDRTNRAIIRGLKAAGKWPLCPESSFPKGGQ